MERALSGETAAGAVEVGGYRSRDLERAVLERERERERPFGGYIGRVL